jgi:hypothetical protein
MDAADVWKILLGAVVALAGTLLAQWSSLAYQTRRQREARRADFQRTTLLQLRDLLGEVEEAVGRAMTARHRMSDHFERSPYITDDWETFLSTTHPDMEVLRSLTYRLRLLATGVEHEPLRIAVDNVSAWAVVAPLATKDKDSQDARDNMMERQIEAVELLGEQLRSLP